MGGPTQRKDGSFDRWHIAGNEISGGAGGAIAEMLPRLSLLTDLDLSCNALLPPLPKPNRPAGNIVGERGVIALIAAALPISRLENLNLRGNVTFIAFLKLGIKVEVVSRAGGEFAFDECWEQAR